MSEQFAAYYPVMHWKYEKILPENVLFLQKTELIIATEHQSDFNILQGFALKLGITKKFFLSTLRARNKLDVVD